MHSISDIEAAGGYRVVYADPAWNCAFLWVKTTKAGDPSMGLGHWTRGNGEPCLLAIRGKPERLGKGVAQIVADAGEATFLGPRGRHSEKPAEVRTRIVELLGDVPRIELFARARSAGWDAWGNEVPGGSDIEL